MLPTEIDKMRDLATCFALLFAVTLANSSVAVAHESEEHGVVVDPTPTVEKEVPREEPEAAPTPKEKQVTGPKSEDVFFEAYWDEGIRYRMLGKIKLVEWHPGEPFFTREPLITGKLGFKLHVDAAAYAKQNGLSGVSGGVEVRRSFFTMDGIVFTGLCPVRFGFEFGVITNSFYLNEAWVALENLPYVGSFKIGQFTAPLSLDAINSSRDRTFMESASPVSAFGLGDRLGSQIADYIPEHQVTWALGWFGDGQDQDVGDASESFARLVGRTTWLPIDEPDAEYPTLVHLGLGVSYLFSASEEVRYQSRPESFIAPIAVDTGSMDSKSAVVIGSEAAFIYGPVSGQFEYLHAVATGGSTGSVNFPGVYLSLGAFLTGETRPYQYDRGRFGLLIPKHPLSWKEGTWGALEWAGRYSFISLDSGPVHGGTMHSLSTGYNWYWNRYIRWQFNYVFSDIADGELDGILHTFQTRFQLVI